MALARKPYVTIDAEILSSSVWSEAAHVKLVWITLLILCDTDGYVGASIPGIATAAGVSLEEAEEALDKFQKPDKYSRTQTSDGRRVEVAERGFRVLNFIEHLDRLSAERGKARDRVRRHRERKALASNAKKRSEEDGNVTVPTGNREKGIENRENGTTTSSVALAPKWNSEAAEIWYQEYKGDAPGKFFAPLKPLVAKYTWERVRPALVTYLAETEAKFVNIAGAFGSAFGTWEERAKGSPRKNGQYLNAAEKQEQVFKRFIARGENDDQPPSVHARVVPARLGVPDEPE